MSTNPNPPKPAPSTAGALNELMEGAKALQAIQAQAAQDALRLPNPRLDEAQPGHYFLMPDGRKVDSEGKEVK